MKKSLDKTKVDKILASNNILENPLLKSFLDETENYKSFENAIFEPSEENKEKVEELFKIHYEKVRFTAYFNKLINNFAVDFDKKIRKLQQRFSLTLDNTQEISLIESTVKNPSIGVEDMDITLTSLEEEIGDIKLSKAIKSLTKTQYKILELIYVGKLTNLEVANLLDSSPQNISNLHRKALKKLKIELEDKKNDKSIK